MFKTKSNIQQRAVLGSIIIFAAFILTAALPNMNFRSNAKPLDVFVPNGMYNIAVQNGYILIGNREVTPNMLEPYNSTHYHLKGEPGGNPDQEPQENPPGPNRIATTRPGWELAVERIALGVGEDIRRVDQLQHPIVDFDESDWGYPDIDLRTSEVREDPDFTPSTLEYMNNNFKYILEKKQWLFDIQLVTVATVSPPTSVGSLMHTLSFIHETAMPYNTRENLFGGIGDKVGKEWQGTAYIRFSCQDWETFDYGPKPANYTFTRYWFGIMNMIVANTDAGKTSNPPVEETHFGRSRAIQTVGSQLAMYPDGTLVEGYAPIPWDTSKILDPNIQASAVVAVSANLKAGAREEYDQTYSAYTGSITEVIPADYYVTYTVRVVGVIVKELQYEGVNVGPYTDPNATKIEPPKDYVPYKKGDWFADLLGRYWLWIVFGVVAFLIFAWIIGVPILFLLGGLIKVRQCQRWKTLTLKHSVEYG